MTVKVVQMQGGGIPAQFQVGSDDFNRAQTPNGLGSEWTFAGFEYTSALFAATGTWFIGGGAQANQCVIQASAPNQNQSFPVGYQFVPTMSFLNGRSQFSELRFISNNAVIGTRSHYVGPTVLGGFQDPSPDYRCYICGFFNDNTQSKWAVDRFDNGLWAGGIGLDGGAGSLAANDLIRLEAVIVTGGVELSVFKNGVFQATVTDVNANRSTFGVPGMHRYIYVSVAVPGTSQSVVDDFACGSA